MDTAPELAEITLLLDLQELEMVEVAEDRGQKLRRLTVIPKAIAGLCPHCGRLCDERHLCRDRKVTDLPMGGWGTELVVRLWQFRCEGCDRFFTPRFAALSEGAHATERFLGRLAELAGRGDVSMAARFFGIPEKTAEEWYYGHLERQRREEQSQTSLKPVRSLGIDELSLKKGTGSSAAG
jgi:transposase